MEERLDFAVYEVFAQADALSPHVHVFNVLASSPDMAMALAEENFFRRAEFVSLWVVRRDQIHHIGHHDREGFEKTPKAYRTTDDYKYLRDKWRYYRDHPMNPDGSEAEGVAGDAAMDD